MLNPKAAAQDLQLTILRRFQDPGEAKSSWAAFTKMIPLMAIIIFLFLGLVTLHIVNIVYIGNILTYQYHAACDQPLIAYLVGAIIISCLVLMVAFIALASYRGAAASGLLVLFFLLVWSLVGSIWLKASKTCSTTAYPVYQQAYMAMVFGWLSFAVGGTLTFVGALAVGWELHVLRSNGLAMWPPNYGEVTWGPIRAREIQTPVTPMTGV
ncbi:uncharacterized protein VTP21DRAFT_4429 [Calcarisporiella thermophila]|uniref:uncharacterized protein n=1 Tax=Calcarisporiella thermophila TaxID=911321 RepID=UPI003742E70E